MPTNIQIRADVETDKKFTSLWLRLKQADTSYTRGETLASALEALEAKLDGKLVPRSS